MAQATPISNILTSKAIAAELAQIAIGCTGLILVPPPITAVVASFSLREMKKNLTDHQSRAKNKSDKVFRHMRKELFQH